ncbi:hypothetical protein [Pectobacterium versatile]|uniref:hypothetical protein n=1 Tax=Pectobacterium versatile TaxID=2488639 RepID=UPI001BB2E8EE|nr:hypothetical protein [Pectobacterium versatile]
MSTPDTIALWAMLGTWASAVVTLVAVFVAVKTLSAWKTQEKIKELKELKFALISYRNLYAFSPSKLTPEVPDTHQVQVVFSLHDAMNRIHAVVTVMEENLLDGFIGKKFMSLMDKHNAFVAGQIDKDEIVREVIEFISINFIGIDKR